MGTTDVAPQSVNLGHITASQAGPGVDGHTAGHEGSRAVAPTSGRRQLSAQKSFLGLRAPSYHSSAKQQVSGEQPEPC